MRKFTEVERRLTGILLLAAGATPDETVRVLGNPDVGVHESGPVPTTMLHLGKVEFPSPAREDNWVLAELWFEASSKDILLILLLYPDGTSEVEVLVSGGTEPWTHSGFPLSFHVTVHV